MFKDRKILWKKHPDAYHILMAEHKNSSPSSEFMAVLLNDCYLLYETTNKKNIVLIDRVNWNNIKSVEADYFIIKSEFIFETDKTHNLVLLEDDDSTVKDFIESMTGLKVSIKQRKWYQKIPGFRSENPWKMITTILLAFIVFFSGIANAFTDEETTSTGPPDDDTTQTEEVKEQLDDTDTNAVDDHKTNNDKKDQKPSRRSNNNNDDKKNSDSTNNDESSNTESVTSTTDEESITSNKENKNTSQNNSSQQENQTQSSDATATVTDVVDGDTIEIKLNGRTEKVRLLLVDTPETVHPSKPDQPFGQQASQFAKNNLSGKQVQVEYDGPRRDKYDRLLAYLWVDGKNFNKMLLRQGLARYAYVYDPPYTYSDTFMKAQNKAKSEGKGIWSRNNYVTSDGFNYQEQKQTENKPANNDSSAPSDSRNNSSSGLKYDPNGPDRDCGDFDTQQQAQDFYEAAGGPSSDSHRLDGNDNDGVVCESLP